MASLTIQTTTPVEGTTVVVLTGAADIPGAAVLERQLLGITVKHPKHVVFDLAGLTFISSLCMGTIMQFRRGCAAWGGKVTLAGANALVSGAFVHAGLNKLLPMVDSVDAALVAS